MNFYCDSGGKIFHVDPERIFQGSVGVNKIRFIGQFPSSAQVLVSYELPNGVITSPKVLTLVDELKELITIDSDRSFSVWETVLCAVPRLDENGKVLKDNKGHIVYDYDYSLTENYGTVNVQFYVYGASKSITVNEQVYNVGNGMLATAKSSFMIERGVPAFVPPSAELLSPDSKVLIAEILNTVSSYATEINGAVDSANAIVKEVTEKLENGDFIGAQGPKGDKGDAGSVKFVAVTELPTENIQYDAIYIVPIPGAEGEENRFTEYVYIDGKWEPLGAITIQVDHSEYVKFTDYASWDKAGVTTVASNSHLMNGRLGPNGEQPYVPSNRLSFAVKQGLIRKLEAWNDEEKTAACETIGAATEKYVDNIATKNETWTFKLKDGTTVTKQVAVKE